MAKVWFRCDRKHEQMFVLNTLKELDNIPVVGDLIHFDNSDFSRATFRVKPFYKDKENPGLKNFIVLYFIVKSRRLDLRFNEWELICEPTSSSVLRLLIGLKIKT